MSSSSVNCNKNNYTNRERVDGERDLLNKLHLTSPGYFDKMSTEEKTRNFKLDLK